MARHHKSHRMHDGKGVSDGYYAGHSDRRRQEMEDSNLISEDHSAIANLPQNVMIKRFAEERDYLPEVLKDDVRSVDEQMGADNSKRKQHFHPHKY
jgi:hypothetical protein